MRGSNNLCFPQNSTRSHSDSDVFSHTQTRAEEKERKKISRAKGTRAYEITWIVVRSQNARALPSLTHSHSASLSSFKKAGWLAIYKCPASTIHEDFNKEWWKETGQNEGSERLFFSTWSQERFKPERERRSGEWDNGLMGFSLKTPSGWDLIPTLRWGIIDKPHPLPQFSLR